MRRQRSLAAFRLAVFEKYREYARQPGTRLFMTIRLQALYRARKARRLANKLRRKRAERALLPECLVTMLKDNLLLNAKRDALAETKKQLFADPKAMEAVRKNKDALKARFEKLAKADVAATASSPKKADGKSVSLERLMQELFDIGVAKEVMVQPISPVKGKTLPSVRTNLTIIDAKGSLRDGTEGRGEQRKQYCEFR